MKVYDFFQNAYRPMHMHFMHAFYLLLSSFEPLFIADRRRVKANATAESPFFVQSVGFCVHMGTGHSFLWRKKSQLHIQKACFCRFLLPTHRQKKEISVTQNEDEIISWICSNTRTIHKIVDLYMNVNTKAAYTHSILFIFLSKYACAGAHNVIL